MKRTLSMIALAALTMGLLGSCSKINERLDNLDKRIDGIESEQIASINSQIAGITSSISDLETIRTNIRTLFDEGKVQGESIAALQAADKALEEKIADLRNYMDTELKKYAESEWVSATFATLEQYEEVCRTIEEIEKGVGDLDERLSKSLKETKDTFTAAIKDLSDRVGVLESKVQTIDGQIESIESSISDLETIRESIKALTATTEAQGEDIGELKEADEAIGERIEDLKAFVNDTLKTYPTSEWVKATYATLAQYKETCDSIAKVEARFGATSEKLSNDIKACTDSLTRWINEEFKGYYTAAQMDAKEKEIRAAIDTARGVSEKTSDSIRTELSKVRVDIDTAKAAITREYTAAIAAAITESEGRLTADIQQAIGDVNDRITTISGTVDNLVTIVLSLLGTVNDLKAMVQSVTIVPAYSDGSVEAKDGILCLDVIVEPAEAVKGLTKESLKVLVNEAKVKTKSVEVDIVEVSNLKVVDVAKGTIAVRADISSKLPAKSGKALIIAVNVKNGLSDYTTEFYPVEISTNVETKTESDTTKVTIKADEDFPEAVMGKIKVEEGFVASKPTSIEVSGIGTVIFDEVATSAIKANANGLGATSVLFKVEDVTTTKPVPNADVVLEVTMKTVDENGKEVFNEENAGGEVTIQIPMDENVVYVNSVTLVNDAGDPIEGGVVPGSEEIENGILTFKVNHFSKYAVDYVTRAEFKEVTGVSLDKTSIQPEVGDTLTLHPIFTPTDATNKKVTWSSSDTTKVKVDDTGKITAVAFGQATITVTTKDGGKTATCTVKVSETKTMADILKTTTGIPESQDLTPPANAWVNSTNPDCKAFVGKDGEAKLFVILKEGQPSASLKLRMDDAFAKIDDNTYQRVEPSVGTFTVKMTEGKFTSLEFNTNVEEIKFLNGTYKVGNKFKAVYNTNGGANTLTFYYDAVDHSGAGITVYEDGTTNYLFDSSKQKGEKWGYNSIRDKVKSVVIDASVDDYKGLTSTAYMFQNMKAATSISGAEYLNVSNVTDMSYMFQNFGGGKSGSPTTLNVVPDVSQWNTGNVKNMSAMFESYGNFSSSLDKVPDVSGWNTGKVTDMTFMFQKYGHESQNFNAVPDVSQWNTGNVTNMANMFFEYGHKSTALNTVPNVSGWNTGKVTNMKQMFNGYGYTSTNISCVLDLSGWDLSKITETNGKYVFSFTPKTFDVTIPAKTGEKSNEGGKWYYGNGTNYITPPTGKTFTILPAGALKGEFSVSATKKVHFSKGNLWYDGSKFNFEANQYDVQTSWSPSHVSHFFWSKDASVAYAASYSESGTAVTDVFFTNDPTDDEKAKADFTVNGVSGKYRTLSKDEFNYLFSRTSKHGFATVGGVYGIIILPDTFTDPMKNGGSGAFKPLPTQGYDANVYTIGGNWEAMESAGAVFLPATNFRKGTNFDQWCYGSGFYWSSIVRNASRVYGVTFNDGTVYPQNSDHERNYGKSVRLVTEVPAAGVSGNGTEQYKNNSNPDWF